MNTEFLYQFINKNDEVKPEHKIRLKAIIEKYPYFQAAIFLYLKSLYQENISFFNEELQRLGVSIRDRKGLFFYIFNTEYGDYFNNKKNKLSEDKTEILLNAFFENYETTDNAELEYNLSHTTLASSDYLSYIGATDKKEASTYNTSNSMAHQDVIDRFIQQSETSKGLNIQWKKEVKVESKSAIGESENLDDDIFFTETLARIYIKQKRYEKAYKIIKHLSLNFPKKNAYFADQLSFLEKLIINSKFKDKK